MGNVVNLDARGKRAASVRSHLQRTEPQLAIATVRDGLNYGDQWRLYAYRCEALLALASAQRDASELLLSMAYSEIERLRGLIE